MANEPKVIFQDGRAYFNRADVPDIGHWERNLVGEYHGLSSEKDKAPTYANLPKRNYEKKLWTAAMVKTAVRKGVITPEQYTEITGKEYKP